MVFPSVSSGASVGRQRVSSFFLNYDWFVCQLQRSEFLRKGSHEGPLFRMFPLSLQSIISNQMRPRRLRGAWFSRLLWHPARRRSGSILNPGTHTGLCPGVAAYFSHPGTQTGLCPGVAAYFSQTCIVQRRKASSNSSCTFWSVR